MTTPSQSSQSHPNNSNPPEAHEVQSVRKQVEGMGVENQIDHQPLSQPSGLTIAHNTTTTTTTAQPSDSTNPPEQKDSFSNESDPIPKPIHVPLDNLKPTSDPLPPLNPTSTQLPASWDAYADLHSPFACFAPRSDTSIFAQPPVAPSSPERSLGDPTVARAFAPSSAFINQDGSNIICPNKFPSGSDFFLKGKRNTPLADSSPGADPESTTQNKKLKLPPSSSSSTPVPASSTSSSSNNTQHGFANYAMGSSTNLKSKALEKLNKNPSLQTSSLQPTSAVSSFMKANQPSSVGSSVCAVNGENDDTITPSSTRASSSLGFLAFANTSGFHDSSKSAIDWSHHPPSSSVFDQDPQRASNSPDQNESNPENSEWSAAKSTQKKTHLALSAELSQEDKHEGFLATEVITGEENEDLIKSVRCKMFTLGEDGSWRERGTGGLRLLRTKEKPYRFRLIMRADAVLRVLLNVPIFKGFNYRPTQEKFLTFVSTVVPNNNDEDKSVNGGDAGGNEEVDASAGVQGENISKTQFQQYLCRFGKPEARQEMIDGIQDCLKQLEKSQYPETDGQDLEAVEYCGGEEGAYDAGDFV